MRGSCVRVAARSPFFNEKGIFNKSTLTIQLNKIQQVNINQSLLQQIIGVYSLDIDTAGSEKKEASIKAIDHLTATRLKQRLLSERDPITATVATPKPMLKLSNATLLKVGITSNYGASILLLMGFIFGLIQFFKDYTALFEVETTEIYAELRQGFGFISICFFVPFIIYKTALSLSFNFR